MPRLTRFLSRVLLDHLRQHMPQILTEVSALYQATEANLNTMGPAVPSDEFSRNSMVQSMVTSFCRGFVVSAPPLPAEDALSVSEERTGWAHAWGGRRGADGGW